MSRLTGLGPTALADLRRTRSAETSLAGLTSRSEATGRSAGIGRWCAAPSRSAGRPCSPSTLANRHRPTRRPPRWPRGGPRRPGIGAEPAVSSSWPVALRAVRAWLIPWSVLALLEVVVTSTARPGSCNGCLTLSPQVSHCTSTYRRNQQTTGRFKISLTSSDAGHTARKASCSGVRPVTTRWTTWRILPKASTSNSARSWRLLCVAGRSPRERGVLRLTATGGPRLRR
jgi:hypothetical protein